MSRMMRRIGYTVLALAAFVILMPALVGFYARHKIVDHIDEASAPFAVQAKILSAHGGWFTSNLFIAIELRDPQETIILATIKLHHGPIIHLRNADRSYQWHWDIFASDGFYQVLDDDLNKFAPHEKNLVFYANTIQPFHAMNQVNFYIPELTLGKTHANLIIGNIHGRVTLTDFRRHLLMQVLLNDVQWPSSNGRNRIQYIAATISTNILSGALWTGAINWKIPQVTYHWHGTPITLNNWQTIINISQGNNAHTLNVSTHADQVSMPNQVTGPLDLQGKVSGLYDGDLLHFLQIQKIVDNMTLPDNIRDQVLDLFTAQALQDVSFEIDSMNLTTNVGVLKTNGFVAIPKISPDDKNIPTTLHLLGHSLGAFNLTAPALLVKTMNPNQPLSLLQNVLLDFYRNGWLVQKDDQYELQIKFHDNTFLMNGKPWLAPRHP